MYQREEEEEGKKKPPRRALRTARSAGARRRRHVSRAGDNRDAIKPSSPPPPQPPPARPGTLIIWRFMNLFNDMHYRVSSGNTTVVFTSARKHEAPYTEIGPDKPVDAFNSGLMN